MNDYIMRDQLLDRLEYACVLTSFERMLLSEIWRHFLQSGRWPKCCDVHLKFNGNRSSIRDAFNKIGGAVVQEVKYSQKECEYHMTALGCVLAADTDLVNSTIQILTILHDKAISGDFKADLKKSEILEANILNELEIREFYRFFLQFRPIGGGSSGNIDSWSLPYGEEIDELMSEDDIMQYLVGKCFSIDLRTPFESVKRDEFRKHVLYEPRRLVAAYHYVIHKTIRTLVFCLIGLVGILFLLFTLELWLPGFHPFSLSTSFLEQAKLFITIGCVLFGIGIFTIIRWLNLPLISWISGILHRAVFRSALLMRWEYYYNISELLQYDWDHYTRTRSVRRRLGKFFDFKH